MKKLLNIILVISMVLTYYIPINLVYADECIYTVATVDGSNNKTALGCYNSYSDAKAAMLDYDSTSSTIAVIYDTASGNLINATYAIAKLVTGKVINIYPTSTSATKYTSVNTSYGIDAAFIDYDVNSGRALIRISGYTGWVDASFSGNYINVLVDGIRMRTDHSTSSAIAGLAENGKTYQYYDTYNDGTYVWYKIKEEENYYWIASKIGSSWTEISSTSSNLVITPINQLNDMKTYYEPYSSSSNLIHYYENAISGTVTKSYTNLGPKPSYLTNSKIYYSFDGNYFYTSLTKMLDDYRNNVSTNAVNKDNPFYAYYMYLPNHSKTGYTAEDFNLIITNKGYTKTKDEDVDYVIFNTGTNVYEFDSSISRSGISLMYGSGQSFVDAANTYGINALMMFGTALNESGNGTSIIAFLKNNLFGLGAADSNPVSGARSYDSVRNSIFDYASFVGSNDSNYSNPQKIYYFGSHYGNKGSGMNVNYATDPYWGEKQAANSYYNDKDYGLQDYQANTIGVTNKLDVKIYKSANTSSSVIYTLKNINKSVYNVPVIVFDKVSVITGGDEVIWYKVYTDVALNENQNIADVDYNFSLSYGYIKAEDLYVENNQPVITASNITIYQNESVNLLSGVSASDTEDGNLTSQITVNGTYDVSIPGTYEITYKVLDSSHFEVNKMVTLTVNPSINPIIVAENIEVSQYTVFDPMTVVSANDYYDGDLTNQIIISSNNVNTDVKGTYQVTYEVVNSLGNKTTKTINVTVITNASPTITASNKTVKVNGALDLLSGVSANDTEDGNLTSQIEIIQNNVDLRTVGTYQVIYQVTDAASNVTTKEITVIVEERDYTKKTGAFYFSSLNYNDTSQKLEVSGYLAIVGMNNTTNENIVYDFILVDNYSGEEIIFSLNRWLDGHPTRRYSDGTYNYSDTWFQGEIDLSEVPDSEYTLYVRARSGNYEAINLFRNVFNEDMTRKATSNDGTGYLFRNNNYKNDYPIELFVRSNGLISTVDPIHSSNMFTSYKSITFSNNSLNIIGASYNINGNYSSSSNVTRYIVLENKVTMERYTYEVGATVGSDIPLKVSDGLSKVKAWFDTTNKIDISDLSTGEYIIYVRTITGNIDDYGELNDIFLKDTSSITTTINGKEYSIVLNKNARFRLELIIE
ncbi:MAG: DUF5011 domain-containing protein [Bacilli bacterium]|nr:DUF5011 domain-containing protein [Bacilli bacterium]